jgi:hypothetical protein
MASHDEANHAMEELSLKYQWQGMDGPMLLRWVDPELVKRRKDEHSYNGKQTEIVQHIWLGRHMV